MIIETTQLPKALCEEYEEKLKHAMLNSDCLALSKLLDDKLTFTNHFGGLMSKEDDIMAHKTKTLSILSLENSDINITAIDSGFIVNVKSDIHGVFMQEESKNSFRFTRVWQLANEKSPFEKEKNQKTLTLISAHSCLIA